MGQHQIVTVDDVEGALARIGVLFVRLKGKVFDPGKIDDVRALPLGATGAVDADTQPL